MKNFKIQNGIFGCHNLIGAKLLTRLRLGLSHLWEHKFKHSFQDTLNPLCSCRKKSKLPSIFSFHVPVTLMKGHPAH